MNGKNKTIGDLLKFWGAVTPAVVLGAIGPWLQPFLHLKLISDYFQPWVNEGATAFAVLALVVAFAYLRGQGAQKLRRALIGSVVILVVGSLICLAFRLLLGDVLALGRVGTMLVWLVWIVAYVAIFVGVAITLCVVGFLSE
jgi:hypothetical protein